MSQAMSQAVAKWNEMMSEVPSDIKAGMNEAAMSCIFYAGYMAAFEVLTRQMSEMSTDALHALIAAKQEGERNAAETPTVN